MLLLVARRGDLAVSTRKMTGEAAQANHNKHVIYFFCPPEQLVAVLAHPGLDVVARHVVPRQAVVVEVVQHGDARLVVAVLAELSVYYFTIKYTGITNLFHFSIFLNIFFHDLNFLLYTPRRCRRCRSRRTLGFI